MVPYYLERTEAKDAKAKAEAKMKVPQFSNVHLIPSLWMTVYSPIASINIQDIHDVFLERVCQSVFKSHHDVIPLINLLPKMQVTVTN